MDPIDGTVARRPAAHEVKTSDSDRREVSIRALRGPRDPVLLLIAERETVRRRSEVEDPERARILAVVSGRLFPMLRG